MKFNRYVAVLRVPLQESSEKLACSFLLVSEAASYYFFLQSVQKRRTGRLAAFGAVVRGGWLPLVPQT